MIFKEIKLQNFRNYKNLSLSFDPKLNIITGQNAQGKTNIIESLFIMGMGKSFRTSKDTEMINFDADFSKASSVIDDDGKEVNIEIIYKKDGKIIKVDNVPLSRTIDLLENVYVVIFSPDDLRIVKDGPDNRRKFLDRELCQIKPVYYSDLGNYKKVLKQRNILLKNKDADKTLFDVFNSSLAHYGVRIIEERFKFIDRLSVLSSEIHRNITEDKEKLEISYNTDFKRGCSEDEFIKILEKNFNNDIYRGFTNIGPHKDDIVIKINGNDAKLYGSQGQQRTAALSLKLAELGIIKQETGKNAVLLLDDVLSELDVNRQRFLISSIKDNQIFITTTEIDQNLMSLLPAGKSFIVDNASVEIYNN